MEKKRKILLVYIILCLAFIWGQSFLPGEESSGESSFILENIIHPFEKAIFGQVSSTEKQVRKAAHVFEYTMLGMGLMGYYFLGEEEKRKRTLIFATENQEKNAVTGNSQALWKELEVSGFGSLSFGVLAALLDETVQLFSGRGSQVRDIWIDSIGILQGTAVIFLLLYVLGHNSREKKRTGI